MKPCNGGHTKSASPTGFEPKLIQSTDRQPRRIELEKNVGTDPYQIPERILGDDYQNPSWKIRRKLENLMSTCPTSNQRYTETTVQLKALQTPILKMENHEKCWPHRCMHMGEEKITVLLTDA